MLEIAGLEKVRVERQREEKMSSSWLGNSGISREMGRKTSLQFIEKPWKLCWLAWKGCEDVTVLENEEIFSEWLKFIHLLRGWLPVRN